ncbi:DUF2971 domain-containing protein [Pseudomonas koreensis]|uniref:DUF2971 domain-containing protein n=1 Tax=Pseudomonas koreensis TaxID=198620 RepID=UPI001B3224D6|nr:DUF2971 domain-containing protein [Pseudomonas koreensis]MBP4000695.1 DUF2971 domain-containing protein [Pseudomonas koreensis]
MSMPNHVYHYTTARTAIDHILRNKTLRLGRLGGVNDPKESKFRDFAFYAQGAKAIAEFKGSFMDEVCNDLADNTYALCCGMSNYGREGRENGALRPHMWANYAGRHSGVCLVLDQDILSKQVIAASQSIGGEFFFGDVNYCGLEEMVTASLPAYSLFLEHWCKDKVGYFDFHVRNYHKEMFFLKHKDWRDESECRWIVRSRAGGPIYVDIRKALVKVVVGHEVSEPDLHYILSQCKSEGIPVHKVVWNAKGSLSQNLADEDGVKVLELDFCINQNIPCSAVFYRISNGQGESEYLAVSSKNGNVVHCGSGNDVRPALNNLGYTEEDASKDIIPSGFSAGRLSEISSRPLDFKIVDGRLIPGDEEEVPYFGANVKFCDLAEGLEGGDLKR